MPQDELAKQVAADLGISELPEDKQKELIAQFGEVALKAATLAVMNKLTAEQRAEFMKLAEAGDSAPVQAFLDTNVPDHETIAKSVVAEELAKFREFKKA
jgi:hypothetical protein